MMVDGAYVYITITTIRMIHVEELFVGKDGMMKANRHLAGLIDSHSLSA